ncbi:MAG: hypothetical protein JWN52_6057 [Actinomycetia bacterium]|nr:hypothetical protein [Actinomycetes bacterium]
MSRLLGRVGGAAAAHPWRTLSAWLVILIAVIGLAGAAGGTPHDDYTTPGLRSQAGTDLLKQRFPEMSGTDARVVIHDGRGGKLDPALLDAVRGRLGTMHGAAVVSPPRLSGDGDTALIAVQYKIPVTDLSGSEGVDELRKAASPAKSAGLQVAYGGQVPENISAPSGIAEVVGIVTALIILVLALGSVVAAGLPLLVALVGLGIGSSIITLLAAVTDISTTAPTIASMVGLGVGIDYALLLVSRHAEGLRRGLTPREAAREATATVGTSVMIAGTTVLVSLFGLKLSTLPVYASFGYATFAVVGAVMLGSVTLVPALCGLAGHRVLHRSDRGARAVRRPERTTRTEKWARWVGRRPVLGAVAALAVLAALAAPMLGMRTWPQDAGSQPTSNTTRVAYDVVASEYGPGANGPMLVAVDLRMVPVSSLDRLAARLRSERGVASVAPPAINRAGDAAVISVQPTTGPQEQATTRLLERLRSKVLPQGALVTGTVAIFADISQRLNERLWIVIAFVTGLSLLLLTVLFRAPVVALKAAVMNLLSIAAAYGVITAVFQTDLGAKAVGLPHAGPVSTWVPILMFTVLFGLSMDYEVFLLSRIREDWLATGDAKNSVVRGLAATGKVITSAAAIMVAVFAGFALDPDVTVKTMGVGMGAAVLIDATVVRMVLVPATMALLGRANWWLPGRLDRLLPRLDGGHGSPETVTQRNQVTVS